MVSLMAAWRALPDAFALYYHSYENRLHPAHMTKMTCIKPTKCGERATKVQAAGGVQWTRNTDLVVSAVEAAPPEKRAGEG